MLKAYLIQSDSIRHWEVLRSKKSLQAVSQNLTSWCLACSYSGRGCAGRFEVSTIALPSMCENLSSSRSAIPSSSSSSSVTHRAPEKTRESSYPTLAHEPPEKSEATPPSSPDVGTIGHQPSPGKVASPHPNQTSRAPYW